MSHFLTKLVVELSEDERTAILHDPLIYESDLIGRVEVPAGFQTDGASVPRVFWNLLPPWGRYGEAAVIHDWLYRTQCFDRAESDAVLREAMLAMAVPCVTRHVIYRAVRMFGWAAWKENQRSL